MGRGVTSGRKNESEKDRWLLAKMAGPLAGRFSSPSTHGRNSTCSHGPMMKCLRNQ